LLQWIVNGFNITFAVFTLVWGVASDRLGYRNTFRLGSALVLVSVVGSALAPNLIVLDVAPRGGRGQRSRAHRRYLAPFQPTAERRAAGSSQSSAPSSASGSPSARRSRARSSR
jgi:MFS family permease